MTRGMMTPILWTFRRCPYAMRARLAIASSGIRVELREIVLRNKPEGFLVASASATVPCLETADGIFDESLEIMQWALDQSDPEGWLQAPELDLIAEADGPFKAALDRYKYPNRFEGVDRLSERAKGEAFLADLEFRLGQGWLTADAPRLPDMAILPFVRQFAHVDMTWFDTLPLPRVQSWLSDFKASARFAAIMEKYQPWSSEDTVIHFPDAA